MQKYDKNHKKCKHTNNKGYRQIKNSKTRKQMKILAKKLGVPYGKR